MDYGDYPSAGMTAGLIFVYVAIIVLYIIGMWKIFTKTGKPGWAAIIPIYNIIILLEVVDKPLWWFILWLIPLVNIVILIVINIELAKKFGQSAAFAVGLILLPMIFYPILGFGSYRYIG